MIMCCMMNVLLNTIKLIELSSHKILAVPFRPMFSCHVILVGVTVSFFFPLVSSLLFVATSGPCSFCDPPVVPCWSSSVVFSLMNGLGVAPIALRRHHIKYRYPVTFNIMVCLNSNIVRLTYLVS